MTRHLAGSLVAALVVAGCATKGAVQQVETELVVLRTQMARQDSVRAAELGRIIALQQRTLDSLESTRESIRQARTELRSDHLDIQASLVTIQELTGQSQRRLSELRRQIDDRLERIATDTMEMALPDSGGSVPPPIPPTPDQLFQASLAELRRGSLGTARAGFHEYLRSYPSHAQVPDALYYLGETFSVDAADSAVAYWQEVVDRFPNSVRAPTALYKTGLSSEQRGDRATARAAYQRIIQQYPRSDEADLARNRLASLRP